MRRRRSLPDHVRRAFRLDLGRRRAVERELDDELRFHLDERVRSLVAQGWTREHAEAEALARFGSYEESFIQLLEAARERNEVLTMFDRMDAIRHDVSYAARQLVRAPALTIIVGLTFALGIGANATMFGVIDRLLLRPPVGVRDPAHIVKLAAGIQGNETEQQTFNYPVYRAIRDRARAFDLVVAIDALDVPLGRGESAEDISGLFVSASYFPMLGVTPAIGRFFRADEDVEPLGAPVVVISYPFWLNRFGGETRALGQALELGDRKFTVIGVTPRGFTGLGITGPDVWMPFTAAGAMQGGGPKWATAAGGSWLTIFARVRPEVPLRLAADESMRIAREAAPEAWFTGKPWSFTWLPIMTTRAADRGVSATVTELLGGMSIIVLLVACANVANLLLARGLRRRREIAVRLALGISRGRLITHLLTESLLLALIGGAAALLVADWGGELIQKLLFQDLAVTGSVVNGSVLAFTATITVATGALTGLLPALQISHPELTSSLKSGARDGTARRSRTRRLLLVAQTAMAVVLLVGAGVFVRSLVAVNDMPLGVDVDRAMVGKMNLRATGRLASSTDRIFEQALARVRKVPGVSHAAVGATVPFGQSWGALVLIPGPDSVTHANAMSNIVTPDYFATLGARVLSGRDFRPSDDAGAPRVMIVSEIFATRYWGKRSPIGACLRGAGDPDSIPCAQVIGVVQNIRRQSIFEDSTGFIYLPMAQAGQYISARELVARADDRDPSRVIANVRRAMQTAAPNLPFADVHLFADEPTVRQELRPFRLGATMFAVFGCLALVLAAIGIYGVVSYDTTQRTKEMGVRIALGARSRSVAILVLREGVAVAAAGVCIGALIVMAGAKFVTPMLYETSARDPLILGGVAFLLVSVAGAACLLPARRAVQVDPIVALREE